MKKLWEKLKKEFFIAETLRYLIIGLITTFFNLGGAYVFKTIFAASSIEFFAKNFATLSTAAGCILAAIFAFFGGIVIEAMGSTGISLLPLIYFLTAYFLGSAARYNHKKNFPSFLVFAVFGTIVRMVSTVAYTALVATRFNLLDVFKKSVFPEAVATLICAVVAYYPIGWICRKIRKKL